jgi:hypothetical protein
MNEHPEDSIGQRISIDNTVAFNKSGAVVKGVVISIKPRTDYIARNTRPWPYGKSLQWVIGIETPDGRVSTVKNTDGILVLY